MRFTKKKNMVEFFLESLNNLRSEDSFAYIKKIREVTMTKKYYKNKK